MSAESRRKLRAVYIKDLGWQTLTGGEIRDISEHEVNGWVRIEFKDGIEVWDVNPAWLIAKII